MFFHMMLQCQYICPDLTNHLTYK
uniref:Uncharacterized protein n=1 Tax=Anguilla anguilla TaxID=7936 RepID=A0A0E9S4H4_ANGAN